MTNRKRTYSIYISAIGLLAMLAFVPNLDDYINDNMLIWALPVLGASTALVGVLVDFQGRARLMLFLVVAVVSLLCLFLVSLYPSTATIGLSTGVPPLLLVAALYGPKDWRREHVKPQ